MTTTREAGRFTITVSGAIDADVAFRPYEEMVAAIEDEAPEAVVLDVSGVEFADSAVIGMLVRMNQHADETGVRLEVRAPSEQLQRVLDITGLGQDLHLS